jgi:hypothetical protein
VGRYYTGLALDRRAISCMPTNTSMLALLLAGACVRIRNEIESPSSHRYKLSMSVLLLPSTEVLRSSCELRRRMYTLDPKSIHERLKCHCNLSTHLKATLKKGVIATWH